MLKAKLTDKELWDAIRIDDEPAFKLLFDRYWISLYKAARQYLKDHEASEEVVHDVFLNIWNRRHELEIDSFPGFLLTAIRYQVYNRIRLVKLPLVLLGEDSPVSTFFEINDGEQRLLTDELKQELNHYLNQLPKRCQEIFNMSRINHLSNQEIAVQLGVSKRTVENQITIALKHLRVCLKHLTAVVLLFSVLK